MTPDDTLDPRFLAGVKLLERTGAKSFQIRYDDEQEPVVWVAVGQWFVNPATMRPMAAKKGAVEHWECAAAINPVRAVLRLCDQMMDGGECTHCGKPSGVAHSPEQMPASEFVCWYQFDPELAVYRRGCEGD